MHMESENLVMQIEVLTMQMKFHFQDGAECTETSFHDSRTV